MGTHPARIDPAGPGPADAIFRRLRREVWVVTAVDGLRRGGLTATWLHSVSLDRDRPAVLLALSTNHHTAELVSARGLFAASLLSREQVGIALRFALASGRDIDKLAGLAWVDTPSELPRLADCQAWLEARVLTRWETGSRTYFWGEVTAAQALFTGTVLVDQELFAAATPQERQLLSDRLADDVQVQRPVDEAWRRKFLENS